MKINECVKISDEPRRSAADGGAMKGSRIIGGAFKRTKIGSVPAEMPVRPILARIKKSLFDILKNRLPDARFLDLFAGSGSVGLEALSRGASRVVFVDADPRSVRWIEKTLEKLPLTPEGSRTGCAVRRADVLGGLAWLNEEFDLVFCGAPYVDGNKKPLSFVQKVLEMLDRDGLVRPGGWVIAQHQKKEAFEAPAGWTHFRTERYGDSVLSFFERT